MPDAIESPQVLEIVTGSEEGRALLAALEARHGVALTECARRLSRLFLMRSPWAPGLRFAGGIALPDIAGLTGNGSFSVAGSGTTIEDALASCAGEAVERTSQIMRPSDIACTATISAVRDRIPHSALQLAERLAGDRTPPQTAEVSWVQAERLSDQAKLFVPSEWCLRGVADGPLAMPGTAMSTGVAAGPTFDAAAERAILELIERDAVALWWLGGRPATAPSLDSVSIAGAVELLGMLRQGRSMRPTWLLDLTTELDIPVIAALSCATDGYGLTCGFAARLQSADAARAAIFELCQMELGLMLARARQESVSDSVAADVDAIHLNRARVIEVKKCRLLHPVGASHSEPASAAEVAAGTLDTLKSRLSKYGIECLIVDLTRAEFSIPVAAALAPELQLMPSSFVTPRLAKTICETGGGARWSNGVSLL